MKKIKSIKLFICFNKFYLNKIYKLSFFLFFFSSIYAQQEMIIVNAGVFEAGLTPDQTPPVANSQFSLPVHTVELWDYKIAKYEVTRELYLSVMGDDPSLYTNAANLPVTNVDYIAALIFCNELTLKEGLGPSQLVYYKDSLFTVPYAKTDYLGNGWGFFDNPATPIIEHVFPVYHKVKALGYRLPTEAEWEYAARGGHLMPVQTKFSGSSNLEDVAWHSLNLPNPAMPSPSPVGLKQSNVLGIHDMTGNIDEMTAFAFSNYSNDPKCNPTRLKFQNPADENLNKSKVPIRGGDFLSGESTSYLAVRRAANMYRGNSTIKFGFRLAQSVASSSTCKIDVDILPYFCDDNGTQLDSTDDFYYLEVTVKKFPGMTTWIANDILKSKGKYDQVVKIGPYKTDKPPFKIIFRDSVDQNFQSDSITIYPPRSCSDSCTFELFEIVTGCRDNGTPLNSDDDLFYVDARLIGVNLSKYWTSDAINNPTGPYKNPVRFGLYPISGGKVTLNFMDAYNNCGLQYEISPPSFTCSEECLLNVTNKAPVCNNNGTSFDPTDDTYSFEGIVTVVNSPNAWETITAPFITGNYNVTKIFGPYKIEPGINEITLKDKIKNCATTIYITPPATCSDSCKIKIAASPPVCNDNGTPQDPTDDFFNFDATITGLQVAANWTSNDATVTSGLYATPITFGPYPVGIPAFKITFNDTNKNCPSILNVTPPPSCSNACSITATASEVDCINNNTPFDPLDDLFTFKAIIQGNQVSTKWLSNDPIKKSGTYNTLSTFGPYSINSGSKQILINDSLGNCNFLLEVNPPSTCSDSCFVQITNTQPKCNNNNTPLDSLDDSFSFDVLVQGQQISGSWVSNDPVIQKGNYNVNTTFGPYPINTNNFSIEIKDSLKSCLDKIDIQNQKHCSDSCNISVTTANLLCDDNNTPLDPLDDLFSFKVNATGINVSNLWESNDVIIKNGVYNSDIAFGPYQIKNGNIDLTFSDKINKCSTNLFIAPPAACSDSCIVKAQATTAICNDNNTPLDISDDFYTVDISITGENLSNSWMSNDVTKATGVYNVTTNFGPYPLGGSNLKLNFKDFSGKCETNVEVVPPTSCSDVCEINFSIISSTCSDNNTPLDSLDDTFEAVIDINQLNGSSQWKSTDPNKPIGSYGLNKFGPYKISEGKFIFTLSDLLKNCSKIVTLDPPKACSNDCEINYTILNTLCNDNGTEADSTDDVFSANIVINQINGSSWTSTDLNNMAGSYGLSAFGPYNIAQGNVIFTLKDATNNCIKNVSIIAPKSCSNGCVFNAEVLENICNDNNSPFDPTDDKFYLKVIVTGLNLGSEWMSNDVLLSSGAYNQEITLGPYEIANGDFELKFFDKTNPLCLEEISILAPSTCSDKCSLDASVSNINCDNNGSPSDSIDDVFYFDIYVTNINGNAYWYSTDPIGYMMNYNLAKTKFGPYKVSDGDFSFTIYDNIKTECNKEVFIQKPKTCSNDCELKVEVNAVNCSDNNTPTNPNDDVYFIDALVYGNNISNGWFAEDINSSASKYNGVFTFGPYNIKDGPQGFYVVDSINSDCRKFLFALPPQTCSDQCGIVPIIQGIICNDNGTVSDSTDDVFYFEIKVSGSNTSNKWKVGSNEYLYNNWIEIGPYPITNNSLSLEIYDSLDPLCKYQLNVNSPKSCSGSCSISSSLISTRCNDNGTPSIKDDDVYFASIKMKGSNVSASWTSNSFTGQYNVVEEIGPFKISDGNMTILIEDTNDGNCSSILTIIAPSTCSDSCVLTSEIRGINCDDNGTMSNPDDDLFGFEIKVSGLNSSGAWSNGSNSFPYDDWVKFDNYQIKNGFVPLSINDISNNSCATKDTIFPPLPCSNDCKLITSTLLTRCDDNGTANNPSDDVYFVKINVNGENTNSSNYIIEGKEYIYGQIVEIGPYKIIDGNKLVLIKDKIDGLCSSNLLLVAPPACSSECVLSLEELNINECFNNGTDDISNDDVFDLSFKVTQLNGSNSFKLLIDGVDKGYYSYNRRTDVSQLKANGTDRIFEIIDSIDLNCKVTFKAIKESCSIDCPPPFKENSLFVCSSSEKIEITSSLPSLPIGTWTFVSGPMQATVVNKIIEVKNLIPGTYIFQYKKDNSLDCDSIISQISLIKNDNVLKNISIERCNEYLWNGTIYNQSGKYNFITTAENGCDSIVVLDLKILEATTSLQTSIGCDSVIIDSKVFYSSETIEKTLLNAVGCDSLVRIAMQIYPSIKEKISVSACEEYTWNGNRYSVSGLYTTVGKNIFGCDSITTLDLKIKSQDTILLPLRSICKGDSLFYEGSYYKDDYNGIIQLQSNEGCDSFVNFSIKLVDTLKTVLSYNLCKGDSIKVNGDWVFDSDILSFNLTSNKGCDSLIKISVGILPTYSNSKSVEICKGDSIQFFNNYIKEEGIYTRILKANNGCDSTIMLNLSNKEIPRTLISKSICENDSLLIFANYEKKEGLYSKTFDSASGCDSLVTIDLKILSTQKKIEELSICNGDSIFIQGEFLSEVGVYDFIYKNSNGCDSTITIKLSSKPFQTEEKDISLCEGDSLKINNTTITTAGIYIDTQVVNSNCKKIVLNKVNLLPTYNKEEAKIICPGDSIYIINKWVKSGIYNFKLSSNVGCDSIVRYKVSSIQNPKGPVFEKDCDLGTYTISYEEVVPWSYEWSNGSKENPLQLKSGTNISLETKAEGGCEQSFVLNLPEISSVEDFIDLDDISLYEGSSKLINLDLDSQLWSIKWKPSNFFSCDSCFSTSVLAKNNALLEALFFHASGCTYNQIFGLDILKLNEIVLPNVIRPDGVDSKNMLFYYELPDGFVLNQFIVFDRWGNKVYSQTKGDKIEWDGTFNGVNCMEGVYTFYLVLSDFKGDDYKKVGNITLIR